MSIFITGATGYIGGTVARRLIDAGHEVRGLVRDEARATKVAALGMVPVIGSLDDLDLLVREARNSTGVIHTADSDHGAAVDALIEGLAGSGHAFLHTSGSSVIGDDARGVTLAGTIFDEDTPFVVAPMKQPRRDIELRVQAAASRGVRSVVICPSNIYGTGTGLNPRSVQIPFLVDQARDSGVVHIVGTGVNRWSNVHIEDVADLFVRAFERAPAGSYYFVENGEASFFDIGASIALRLGFGQVVPWSAEEAAKRWGEMHAYFTFGSNSRIQSTKAREELGWAPKHSSALRWIEREMPL
jgi:nucleoside-diphosphate-sugar epimerase